MRRTQLLSVRREWGSWPAGAGTSWNEALIWAASSGVAMAVTRLVAQRGAAEAWKAKQGSYPPGLETVSP